MSARRDPRAVVYRAASLVLSYPDDEVLALRAIVRRALLESAPRAVDGFAPLLDWWEQTPVDEVQRAYVEMFDMSKRHALYLSYWTDGDTRRRGQVLVDFTQRYRAAGLNPSLTGELPDHLPLVLEFASSRPDDGAALLQEYRASLELIRIALAERDSPYAGVLAAVCATLPGVSPRDRQQAMALAASGPPRESVGLDPYDPRLLPMAAPAMTAPMATGSMTGGR